MSTTDDVPASIHRAIFLAVVFYFTLLIYGQVSAEPLATYAAEFVFGAIAVGVGTTLALQARGTRGPQVLLGAAACLVVGGALQFAALFTRIPSLEQGSSLLVFLGIGIYLYAVWNAD